MRVVTTNANSHINQSTLEVKPRTCYSCQARENMEPAPRAGKSITSKYRRKTRENKVPNHASGFDSGLKGPIPMPSVEKNITEKRAKTKSPTARVVLILSLN